jgi:hypothetical protein
VFGEALFHLPEPLVLEMTRNDDERPIDESSILQLLKEQARHDCLAGAGVVSEEKPDAGVAKDVMVNSFDLVRQRVYLGDVDCV